MGDLNEDRSMENTENDRQYYTRRARQLLDLAAAATDLAVKAIHLNLASRYATQSEEDSHEKDGTSTNR